MVGRPQDVADRSKRIPWGVCIHTTGSGLLREAKDHGIDPLAMAVELYCGAGANFPHHVIDWAGTILQIADEKERARHAGIDHNERALYLSGGWRKKVSAVALKMWDARWPGKKSPLNLFPSISPNEDYLGVEMIPLPMVDKTGSLFTQDQYNSLGDLLADIERRYNIRVVGQRLVGHEDLEPLTRWTSKGGWDPGAMTTVPVFHWDRIPGRGNGVA